MGLEIHYLRDGSGQEESGNTFQSGVNIDWNNHVLKCKTATGSERFLEAKCGNLNHIKELFIFHCTIREFH